MLAHERDDALYAGFFELVTDVDQDDRAHELWVATRQRDGGDAAERSADDGHRAEAELVDERGQGRGDLLPTEDRRTGQAVGVTMAGQVRGQHVVRVSQRLAELLVHVCGLAAAVQGEHRGPTGAAPFEVVHLATVDVEEAAPAALGDVVAVGVTGRTLAAGDRVRCHSPHCAWNLTRTSHPGA